MIISWYGDNFLKNIVQRIDLIIIIVYELTFKKNIFLSILSTELFLTSGACAPHKKFNILQRTSDDVSTWSNPIKHNCIYVWYSGNRIDKNIEPFNDSIYGTNKIHLYTFNLKQIKPSEHIDLQYGVTTKVRNSIFSLEGIFHYGEKNHEIKSAGMQSHFNKYQ